MGQSTPFTTSPLSREHLFFIGRDSGGCWVVRDRTGAVGGLFVDRKQALHFAMFENGASANAVVFMPGGLELDMDVELTSAGHPTRARRVHRIDMSVPTHLAA